MIDFVKKYNIFHHESYEFFNYLHSLKICIAIETSNIETGSGILNIYYSAIKDKVTNHFI